MIGFSGSDTKCDYLKSELGFDFAFNYKKVGFWYLGCRIQCDSSSISPELFDQFSDSKLKSTLGQEFPSLGLLFPAVHRFSWDNSKEKNDFITLFSMIELFAG